MGTTGTTRRRPNVLLVVADQMTPFLCGAYGHPVVQTPHLAELAARGVRFDAAYSPYPVCAPARACMLTGTYVSTNQCWDNAAPFACDLPTIAHYLTTVGYDTALAGKMHFVGPDQLHGFHRRFTTDVYPEEFAMLEAFPPWTHSREHDPDLSSGVANPARHYVGGAVHVGRWGPYRAYDESAHFHALQYLRAKGIERHRVQVVPAAATGTPARDVPAPEAGAPPFFLCVSYHHPHDPFWPPHELWNLYERAPIDLPEFPDNLDETLSAMDRWLNAHHCVQRHDLRNPEGLYRLRRAYYALVTFVDRKVGELVATLKEQGLYEDTIVLFTSDHGDMLCEKGMVQKRSFYEWSCRVPLLMRLPGDEHAGTVRSEPVSLVDILPTLLDVAAVRDEDRLPVDGTSLMSLLGDGAPADAGRREVFAEMHSEGVAVPCFMLRRGPHKYVYIHGEAPQLFDLEVDPGEWRNLASDPRYARIEAELRARILERFSPENVERLVTHSLRRRRLVHAAMRRSGTTWDYVPRFDASRNALDQYLPRT